MRDKYGAGQDSYCYPGSAVLKNQLGITDNSLLDEAEQEITAINAQLIDPTNPPYTLHDLQNIHRQLFADIYAWAGEIRSVDISKDETRFCTASRIVSEATRLFTRMEQARFFDGLAKPELVSGIADFYVELNVIHPFREGNGRAQRILFEHLIVACGYEIDWSPITQEEWIQANIAGYMGDTAPMIVLFGRCIGNPL
ncbi:putative adenosine monophosphate-protein transferase Fic [Silvimonas iriomotensis]|uniref:protein adenylyltransferase n=1 Tax=Silvimonas iriomotensis TaxID=449662 RepID=A0ABQ2PF57_9NEIS|nr:putative adenosine monophosphate-protein transferase Fic [Silvimonas iriomotensis]GGP23901.1 cell division protein Fic [Silvimonas iriomotensis]